MTRPAAIAIAAHPDDIEFKMCGTLLLLKRAGWEIHCFNVANGSGGSLVHDAARTAEIRSEEARRAAAIIGAHWHAPVADDLEIFYNADLLRKVAAVIRDVRPSVVLTHPFEDYMEDHMNTARLAVTAAFAHQVPNFRTIPPRDGYEGDVTVYHCVPHGGRDQLRRRVVPGSWANTSAVHGTVREALSAHRSQKDWLDSTQGMSSYLTTLDEHARLMGRASGRFEMAEGWWRHLHLGFSRDDIDPLAEVLGEDYLVNKDFEESESPEFDSFRTKKVFAGIPVR